MNYILRLLLTILCTCHVMSCQSQYSIFTLLFPPLFSPLLYVALLTDQGSMITSTPDEHDFDSTASGGSLQFDHTPLNQMAPPIHPPLRHSSTDTSTTSTSSSSGTSSCHITKTKGVIRFEGEDRPRGMYDSKRERGYCTSY